MVKRRKQYSNSCEHFFSIRKVGMENYIIIIYFYIFAKDVCDKMSTLVEKFHQDFSKENLGIVTEYKKSLL